MLTIQGYLNELKGRIDIKEVASTHLENLKKAERRVENPKHHHSFKGSKDDKVRAAYEFIAFLAAGKADYGMSYKDQSL